MKPATQRRIIRALRQRIERVVGKIAADEQAARNDISALLKDKQLSKSAPPKDADMQRGFRAGLALGLWPEVAKTLKTRPEPTKQELEKFLNELQAADLEFVIRSSLGRMMRKLPPFPPGKQHKFNSQKRKEIIAEVQRLTIGTGSRKKAYGEVAKKHGAHWRTIQNLCLKAKRKEDPRGEEQ
jgi:hypothetical protein